MSLDRPESVRSTESVCCLEPVTISIALEKTTPSTGYCALLRNPKLVRPAGARLLTPSVLLPRLVNLCSLQPLAVKLRPQICTVVNPQIWSKFVSRDGDWRKVDTEPVNRLNRLDLTSICEDELTLRHLYQKLGFSYT